ncbi:PrsW family glutamic-type intramembrane protease [Streptomyces sp. NPDC020766]|uniref:PrsW family glutamic-type intramembrane protease n=1 Tax=Streptomyces sp. NPDC020766 TaxID=3155011 RepID=UPI0033FD5722
MTDNRPVLELDVAVARGWALLVARLAIGLYLVELLLNLTRPKVFPDEPALTIFEFPGEDALSSALGGLGSMYDVPRAAFWGVLTGITVGIVLQVIAARGPSEGRRATVLAWVTLAALLGSFSLFSLFFILKSPLIALACVPTSAFALWLMHRCQWFARLPVPMLLTTFGWGALVQFGLGRACTSLASGTIYGHLGKDMDSELGFQLSDIYRATDLALLHLSVVNQLAGAAGIVLLLMMFRHRVTDVVTGLVLGAATGLGYNFSESVLFIRLWGDLTGQFNGATGGFEYWIRQGAGLFGGQVVCGALLGAGIGLAAGVRGRGRRGGIVAAGLVAAVGAAVANETLAAWFSKLAHGHVDIGGTFDTLVISPALWLAPQVPFFVVCVLLLRSGLRERAAAARQAVTAEAAAGGVIAAREVPFLVDPALRFWTLVSTWRRHGHDAALALRRFQRAQLEVAGWLWQRARADEVPGAEEREGAELREKVLRLRTDVDRLVAP